MVKANVGALGYKAPEIDGRKVNGLATIKVGENRCIVTFEDGNKKFSNGKSECKFDLDDLPKFPHLQPTPKDQNPPRYRVRLNKDATEIESIIPANGTFSAKLVDFGRRDGPDGTPNIFEKVFKPGTPQENKILQFTAIYKIVKGAMRGAQAIKYLNYKFVVTDDGFTTFDGNADNPKATRLHEIINFCNIHQMSAEPIPWPEDGNVLSILLERGLEADREVQIFIKDGYVQDILEVENYGDSEPPDNEPSDEEIATKNEDAEPDHKEADVTDDDDDL